MKKLFTIDDFIIAFISALGYGYGETIAQVFGWPEFACVIACFALGIASEEIITKIVYSRAVQKSRINRVLTYIVIVLVFLAGHYISVRWLGVSMLESLEEEFAWVVGLPVVGFFVNLIIRAYRIHKIRRVYGDGSEGYVFDLDEEDIEDANERNKPITGTYDTDIAVKTKTGIFVGKENKKMINYHGIPYAKPPVGELRWRAPQPLPPSDKVYEAVNYGASAIQVEHKGSIIKHHRQSENCLTLNICVSNDKAKRKKPVLVVFHHGDFTCGGSVDPLLEGDSFISDNPDIVFVSFNYRLGIFGFIDFSEIPGGEECPDTLNLGLLDQIAALEWIKDNISAFGGDPERITVLGFESGAVSILLLASSGKANSLFKRAFVFNGNPITAYDSPEASRTLAKSLLKETQTFTMEELLVLKTKVLKKAAQKLWQNMCAPTCDGDLIPVDVYKAFREGAASGIEFIIGIPRNQTKELKALVGDKRCMKAILSVVKDMRDYIDEDAVDKIKASIEDQMSSSSESEVKSKLVNQWLALCNYHVAETLSEGGNKVHMMYWDENPIIEKLGTGTVDATATFLYNNEALQMYGNVVKEDLSEILQCLLKKFIKGNALKLYHNEIVGINAFDWKKFPESLIVSDGKIQCDKIDDKITEIEELLE